jgi:hypothetical protein
MQHDYILLDRSGSMIKRWAEALSSVNSYVAKLAEDKVDTGVTLATFDFDIGVFKFEIIRDRIIPSTWHPVTDKDCRPRGGTPLNDAVVKIASMALAANYDRVAITIMTDGEENQSKEDHDGKIAKHMLGECRRKGWQVIMLGVDFDNWHQAQGLGNLAGSTASVAQGQMVNSTRMSASKRAQYAATGATMDFSDEEKAELAKKKGGT